MKRQDMADLWEFMSLVGCRIGEACALRWTHVELDEQKVTLGPSVTRETGVGLYIHESSKTDESMRRIVVPKRAIEILRKRKEDGLVTAEGLVFPTMTGKLRDPSNTLNRWRENRDRLGYPEFKSHGFRKTVATMLDSAGMSARDIAEYLGHKHPSMTQDVYMNRNQQSDKMAAAIELARPRATLFSGDDGEDEG
jgi:integrase